MNLRTRDPRPSIYTRIDLKCLASLALYLTGRNGKVESRSSMIRTAVERYVERLQSLGRAQTIKTVDEARLILARMGLDPVTHSRTKRSYLRASELEGDVEGLPTNERITLLGIGEEERTDG